MSQQPEIHPILFSQKENKTCAEIIFQEQKNNSRKIKNNYSGICVHAHKKMENNYSGIYFTNHPTGKNLMESSGCGVVKIHFTPPAYK